MGSSAPWKFQIDDRIRYSPQGSQPRLLVVTEIDLENEIYGFDGLFGDKTTIEAHSTIVSPHHGGKTVRRRKKSRGKSRRRKYTGEDLK